MSWELLVWAALIFYHFRCEYVLKVRHLSCLMALATKPKEQWTEYEWSVMKDYL